MTMEVSLRTSVHTLSLSLRTSAHTGVAISDDVSPFFSTGEKIPTAVTSVTASE